MRKIQCFTVFESFSSFIFLPFFSLFFSFSVSPVIQLFLLSLAAMFDVQPGGYWSHDRLILHIQHFLYLSISLTISIPIHPLVSLHSFFNLLLTFPPILPFLLIYMSSIFRVSLPLFCSTSYSLTVSTYSISISLFLLISFFFYQLPMVLFICKLPIFLFLYQLPIFLFICKSPIFLLLYWLPATIFLFFRKLPIFLFLYQLLIFLFLYLLLIFLFICKLPTFLFLYWLPLVFLLAAYSFFLYQLPIFLFLYQLPIFLFSISCLSSYFLLAAYLLVFLQLHIFLFSISCLSSYFFYLPISCFSLAAYLLVFLLAILLFLYQLSSCFSINCLFSCLSGNLLVSQKTSFGPLPISHTRVVYWQPTPKVMARDDKLFTLFALKKLTSRLFVSLSVRRQIFTLVSHALVSVIFASQLPAFFTGYSSVNIS